MPDSWLKQISCLLFYTEKFLIFIFFAILCLNVLLLRAPRARIFTFRRGDHKRRPLPSVLVCTISVLLPILQPPRRPRPGPFLVQFSIPPWFLAVAPHAVLRANSALDLTWAWPPASQLTLPSVQPPSCPLPPRQALIRWCNNRYCDILLLLLCMIDMMLFNLWRFSMYTYIIYPYHENSVTFLHVLCGLLLTWQMSEPSIWNQTPPLLDILARCYFQLNT